MGSVDDMAEDTVDMTALNAAKTAAMTAYNAAKKAVADVEADRSADMASYDEAVKQRDAAMEANTKAQAATTVANAEKYKKMAENANTEAMKYANMVTTAANNAAGMARIEGLTKAIADPDGDGTFPEDSELRTSRRPGSEPTYASGGVTTVGNDELGKNDVNILNSEEFNVVASAVRASISGFSESVYERTKSGKTDTLTIYTDATSDKNEPFNNYYADASGTDRNGISATADPAAPATGRTTYRVLTFEATAANLALIAEKMKGPRIPTGANGRFAVEAGEDGEFMGTFDGIPGTYSCTVACTIITDDDGQLSITNGPLTFTPRITTNDIEDVHMVKGVTKDMDYVSFGYWVQTSTKSDGSTAYGVNTFAGGTLPFGDNSDTGNNTSIEALEGSATYEGSATGMYARKALAVENGSVVGTPDAAGQFVADVELTANFGASASVAEENAFNIGGTASNFQDADGNVIDSGWTLDLNAASFGKDTSGTVENASNMFRGTTGKGSTVGQWRGQFFGMLGTGDAASSTHPSSVAGEFTGHFDNGHVIGAFGATSQDE
ncbi:MAG: hypothetical protein F4X01_04170 [Nitrospira sp. SB0661_bin_20]|nr:hypothetical protein [Nitrospira sp. SB0661_bin_20]MYJ22312.1 hypothetical protein [Nitrospira sp. SB0673_bin_12]